MSRKMIVLDLDGTVINSQGRVSARTREAVQAVRGAGHLVLVATGRRLRSALPYLQQLGIEGPSSFLNGALTVDLSTWRTLNLEPLGETGAAAAADLMELGYAPLTNRHALKGPDILYTQMPQHVPAWLENEAGRGALGFVDDLLQAAAVSLKLVTIVPEDELSDLAEAFNGHARAMATPFGDGYGELEVWRPDVSKATAVQRLAAQAGIDRRDVVAFGDNVNDVELLSWAGLGVALGNAVPEALTAARLVTSTCDEDGVAATLESLVSPLRLVG